MRDRERGNMRLRRIVAATVLAGVWLTAGVTTPAAHATPAAPAAPGDCLQTIQVVDPATQKVRLVCVKREPGGDTEDPVIPDNDGDYDPLNYTECIPWSQAYPAYSPQRPSDVSPEAVAYLCIRYIDGAEVLGPPVPQWFEPGEAPLPSPAEVADEVRLTLERDLHAPVLEPYPARDVPAYVTIPTFVAVSNWQDAFTEGGCDATNTICVTLTFTPTLTFDPGEEGAETITCPPGGTLFDPDGGTPREQATPGTCTHAYEHRTTGGLPDWPGVVTVSWEVTWEEDPAGGDSGVFPLIELPADLPRGVGESQSVVVNGPSGEGERTAA